MFISKKCAVALLTPCVACAALVLLVEEVLAEPPVAAQAIAEPAAQDSGGSKNQLTAENWEKVHRLLRLQPGEFKWDAVPWVTSIWHARKQAAAEDKPLFVFRTGGAGFSDPLGNC